MIKFENVSFKYKTGVHALHDINLLIEDGEFVYITGTTGSGKSTLIKLLDSEEVPTKGVLTVNNINLCKLRYNKVPLYRRTIGVVFQDYKLLPMKTVFENVAYAMEVVDAKRSEIRKRTKEVIRLVGLTEKFSALPKHISGGQKQRTAIARAIVNRPKLLIADEPTGNLDPQTSEEIINLFEKINKEEGTTIIIVTHDATIVRNHPKRTIKIEQGHIVDDRFGVNIEDVVKAEEKEKTMEMQLLQETIEKEQQERAEKIEAME